MYIKQLPLGINNYIFRFLSHPVADAIRDSVTEFQMFSKQFGSSDLHTFYIFFFLDIKITALPMILDEMYGEFGVNMGIDSDYFRPSLWQLYESQFPGYFSHHFFVDTNRATFRSNKRIYSQI